MRNTVPRIRYPTSEIFLLCLLFASCGYHVSGKADLLPKRIHTIAIPVVVMGILALAAGILILIGR